MRTYFRLGAEHILLAVDHLLFVLGLLLLVRNLSMLLKTITAFTIAHSVTLTAATLGYIHIAAPPLNAAIAVSIMFVGIEVARARRGETTLASRNPWAVAFTFGLLRGVGFASGLIELGLSAGDIPIAIVLQRRSGERAMAVCCP